MNFPTIPPAPPGVVSQTPGHSSGPSYQNLNDDIVDMFSELPTNVKQSDKFGKCKKIKLPPTRQNNNQPL